MATKQLHHKRKFYSMEESQESKKKPLNNTKIKSISNLFNQNLPIMGYKQVILASVDQHATTIVIGETGSGKSTQIPQFLIDSNKYKRVICTQPRRVAAVTIAQRVSEERLVKIGEEVGYSIRFEDKTTYQTKIKYATDGVLLREIMSNPNLEGYDVVILDEAHERSLQTDILMGLLRKLQEKRLDLKVIVMSATLQVDLFMDFFKDPSLVTVPGRQYDVDIYYLREPEEDYVDAAMLACLQIHENEESGDVLVFLPGQEEIESLQILLEQNLPKIIGKNNTIQLNGIGNDFVVRPLYASLPADEQFKAFQPSLPNVRKFILSTNIAETSVTISGIKYVIDTGYVKIRLFQPNTGVEMLKITAISQSQANQRAGRAGRECSGKCYRLYTESGFESLSISSIPEIQRVNLAQVILQLMALGMKNLTGFPFLSPPSTSSLRKAFEDLFLLGALDKDQNLTVMGRKMSQLPLDPTYSNLLIKSEEFKCISEILTAVSMLSSDKIYIHPSKEQEKQISDQAHRQFASQDGDLLTLVTIYQAWLASKQSIQWCSSNYLSHRALSHAHNIRQQLVNLLETSSTNSTIQSKSSSSTFHGLAIDPNLSSLPDKEPFLKCLSAGLCLQIAKRTSFMHYNPNKNQFHSHNDSNNSSNSGNNNIRLYQNKTFTKPLPAYGSIDDDMKAPYKTLRGDQPVHIHPSSALFSSKKLPEYVVYAELLTTAKQYMRNVTAIDKTWLPIVASHVIKDVQYEYSQKKV